MLESDIAGEAVRLLGTAIGVILEDAAPAALKPGATIPDDYAEGLLATGQDVSTLAAAIGVLVRRAR